MTYNEIVTTQPDWWSRLIAVGSILIAGTALWFTQEDKFFGNAVEGDVHSTQMVNQLRQVDEALKLVRQQSDDNLELKQELMDRGSRMDLLATKMESFLAVDQGPTADASNEGSTPSMSKSISDPNNLDDVFGDTGMVGHPVAEDANLQRRKDAMNDDDVADLVFSWLSDVDEDPIALNPPPGVSIVHTDGPDLKIVRVTRTPLSSDFEVNVTLKNVGNRPAVLSELSFQPSEILYNIPTTYALKPLGQSTDSELVVTLMGEHNQSKEAGAQGKYVYRLPKSYVIPADKTIDVRMAILDDTHLGFGLGGTLELTLNGAEAMLIPNVHLAFVGTSGDANP